MAKNLHQQIADLERNDPEISRLSDAVRKAGDDTETAANRTFNEAVSHRLGVDL